MHARAHAQELDETNALVSKNVCMQPSLSICTRALRCSAPLSSPVLSECTLGHELAHPP